MCAKDDAVTIRRAPCAASPRGGAVTVAPFTLASFSNLPFFRAVFPRAAAAEAELGSHCRGPSPPARVRRPANHTPKGLQGATKGLQARGYKQGTTSKGLQAAPRKPHPKAQHASLTRHGRRHDSGAWPGGAREAHGPCRGAVAHAPGRRQAQRASGRVRRNGLCIRHATCGTHTGASAHVREAAAHGGGGTPLSPAQLRLPYRPTADNT
jgi:hypothetical protein